MNNDTCYKCGLPSDMWDRLFRDCDHATDRLDEQKRLVE